MASSLFKSPFEHSHACLSFGDVQILLYLDVNNMLKVGLKNNMFKLNI